MKLILDDKRPMPNDSYNCVRTYEECIELLHLFKKVRYISLDYDLGGNETGYDVLVHMVEHAVKAEHINIHSDHTIGVPKMREYAQLHFPESILTFNPL